MDLSLCLRPSRLIRAVALDQARQRKDPLIQACLCSLTEYCLRLLIGETSRVLGYLARANSVNPPALGFKPSAQQIGVRAAFAN